MQQVAPQDEAQRNGSVADAGPFMRPARIAESEGLQRSTVKRYLDQYPELLQPDGTIDLERFRRHRADNPNVDQAAKRSDAKAPPQRRPEPGRLDAKRRLDEIKVEREERALAIEARDLVQTADVEDRIAAAVMALRDRLLSPDQAVCERLAAEKDPRMVMAILHEAARKLLDELAASMRAQAT